MVYKSTNDSLDRYSILQNLSEKHGLASLSGLVPCGAPSPGCSVAWGLQRRVPRVMLQSGVTQVWLSGSQRQEPTCVCYAPSVARKVWMTSWVDVEASGEIPHVYVPNISHLSKTECDYSLCSWTLRRILSIDLLEHIPFFFSEIRCYSVGPSCEMGPSTCSLWSEGSPKYVLWKCFKGWLLSVIACSFCKKANIKNKCIWNCIGWKL